MKTQQVATGGLIVRKDGKFLLVQRSLKDDFMPGFWELPGGGSEYGETPQEALKREIKEECGTNVNVHLPLTTGQYFMGETQRVEIIFLCSMIEEKEIKLSEEHSAFAWVSVDELQQYKIDKFMDKILQEATANLDFLIKKNL